MNQLLNAIGFLTVIPIPGNASRDTQSLKHAWMWFPFAGAVVGLVAGGVFLTTTVVMGMPALMGATIAVAFLALITRGLHYDGVADVVDAAFGGHTTEDRLRIMKDPHVGSFAVVALVLIILLQVQFIALLTGKAVAALVAAEMISRWATIRPMLWTTYAKKTGLGLLFEKSAWRYIATTLLTLGATYVFIGSAGILLMFVASICAYTISLFARYRFGGMTGDICGCIIIVTELIVIAGYPLATQLLH
jgi:adenosylcobinamide-GDP ribazoletransferase